MGGIPNLRQAPHLAEVGVRLVRVHKMLIRLATIDIETLKMGGFSQPNMGDEPASLGNFHMI